jgi:outer membrane protein assembly factor BamB
MTLFRTTRASFALAAVALGVGLGACAGEEHGDRAAIRSVAPRQTPTPLPPRLPQTAVRVVDGDSGKAVRGAVVRVPGREARTDRGGVAALGVVREQVTVRVSARAYEGHTARLDFRKRLVHVVRVWRPALQWPIYGVTPARTQVHAGIKLRPPFRVVWKRSVRGLMEFPAVVWDGVAYVNTIHGVVWALSMRTGRTIWRRRVGRLMASSPAVDPKRGLLVVTSMSPGSTMILSMKTGHVRWRYATGLTEPSPVIRNGIAYFGATNGNVYALDLDRRRARWIFHGGAKITSSPALVGNRVYVGDYSGRVFALNARTGRRVWTGSAGSRVYGTVAVAGGRVFAPSVSSGMSALSAKSGRLLWRIPVGAYLYSSPAVFKNRVYFGTYSRLVYCADARTGRVLWTRPGGGPVSGAVEIVAGVVYAASIDDRMTAWNWRTGRKIWAFGHGEYVPVSGNASLLLLHGHSRLWAVRSRHRRP